MAGCVGPGDYESVDSMEGAGALYERDVMGGQTPSEAEALIANLTERYSKAIDPGSDATEQEVQEHEALVEMFRYDIARFYVDTLSYELALEYFDAAIQYELSKFPPNERTGGTAPPDIVP